MTTLGRYEILEELGRGGFAVVYRARDPDLDRDVALKVLAPHLTWDPTFAERFRQEAQATAKLRHPNIVVIYDVGEDDEQLYIAMEFLPGPTLAEHLQEEGALRLEEALPILEQVALALDYAHGEGVLHRDVKPSNVMISEDKQGETQATLTDFGLVKAMESSASLTSMGTILGSPEYMAPEQADPDRLEEIGPATDCYALGVVAYEMLVGRVPFPGSTPSTLVAQMQKPPPDPQSLRQDLRDEVAQVLLKALSKQGHDRYASAGELVQALRDSLEASEEARQQEDELQGLYDKIQRAIGAEDWAAAEGYCREMLAQEPDYRDVPELWVQVRTVRTRQRELEELYAAAQGEIESESWDKARDLCLQIHALQPGYRDVDEMLAEAERELGQAHVEKDHEARLFRLYQGAQAALQGGRWEQAQRLCLEIQDLAPGYRDVDEILAEAQEGVRREETEQHKRARLAALYQQAEIAVRQKRWEDAQRLLLQIEALEPGYRDTAQLMARAEEAVAREATAKRPAPAPVPAVSREPEPTLAQRLRQLPGYVWVLGAIAAVIVIALAWMGSGGPAQEEAPAVPVATEARVEPTEARVEPTEARVEPTEARVEPTEAPPPEPTEAPAEMPPPTEAPMEEEAVWAPFPYPLGGYLERALTGEYAGTTVVVDGPYSDWEADAFNTSMDAFEEATGIQVNYIGDKEFEARLAISVDAGDAPDIADFPQPGLLAYFVSYGQIVDPTTFISVDWLQQQYNQSWLDMATMWDQTAGVWHRYNGKSLVWYPRDDFEAAGYEIPETWEELLVLTELIADDGGTPWCIGIESGAATGWPATDWLEDIMLRTTGLQDYDDWARGGLPFSSPQVMNAAETMARIWFNDEYVYGGTDAIVSTYFGNAPAPMFEDPPGCWLHRQGNFITGFFPEDAEFGRDYDFFYLPPIDEGLGRPFLIAGDIMAMFNDRPEVRALMEYFTTGESTRGWLEYGGALSPHEDTRLDWYGTSIERKIAGMAREATSFRFDGSDLMPGEVGAGSFWQGMTDWLSGAVDLDTALQQIDASWPG